MSGVAGGSRLSAGITLLELLVTLAIVSVLAALLSQLMVQLAGMERALDAGRLERSAPTLLREQLRAAVEAAVPVSVVGDPRALLGDSRTVNLESAAPPGFGNAGLSTMRIELSPGPGGEETLLWVQLPGLSGAPPRRWVVDRWAAADVVFRYLAHDGRELEQWPPQPSDGRTLPAAIFVKAPRGAGSPLVMGTLATPRGLPGRQEILTE